jgi:hypothetical protein
MHAYRPVVLSFRFIPSLPIAFSSLLYMLTLTFSFLTFLFFDVPECLSIMLLISFHIISTHWLVNLLGTVYHFLFPKIKPFFRTPMHSFLSFHFLFLMTVFLRQLLSLPLYTFIFSHSFVFCTIIFQLSPMTHMSSTDIILSSNSKDS